MTISNGEVIEKSEPTVPTICPYVADGLDAQKPGAAVARLAQFRPLERRSPEDSWAPKRRSGRLTLDFPVEVYGQGRSKEIFHEETRTLVVSAYGALISLAADVELGQAIFLTCRDREAMRCRVVHREEMANGQVHVGIAFMTYAPKFWGVSFPTESYRAQAA